MKKTFLYLLIVAGILLLHVASASAQAIHNWSDIPENVISPEGRARVIVLFEVPGLNSLTRASVAANDRSMTKDRTRLSSSRGTREDIALNKAIAEAADQILAGLGTTDRKKSSGHSFSLKRRFNYLPLLSFEVSRETLKDLQADPRITAVFADTPSPLPVTPKVEPEPSAGTEEETSLSTEDIMSLIGADKAWEKGYTGTDWYVAILDTGIRRSHEMFMDKDIVEACFSQRRNCPNEESTMIGPGSASHLEENHLGYDHGTHVSGIAAGANPDETITGVAKDSGIIAVNVFSSFSPEECESEDPCVKTYQSDQLAALLHIYSLRHTYNIGAVNMSLGGGRYSEYCDDGGNYPRFMAIQLLREAGIPTVTASGNDTFCQSVGAPSCTSSAVTVMASNKSDMEAKFNNWHSEIGDIFAPGQGIVSAVGSSDNDYEEWNGTSMATPHVSGAFTLMRQARPHSGPDEFIVRLTEAGPSITTPCSDGGNKPRLYVDNFGYSQREKADILFDGLEKQYPEILYPQTAQTQLKDGYVYRHYTGKDVYLATYGEIAYFVQDGEVIELGEVDELLELVIK